MAVEVLHTYQMGARLFCHQQPGAAGGLGVAKNDFLRRWSDEAANKLSVRLEATVRKEYRPGGNVLSFAASLYTKARAGIAVENQLLARGPEHKGAGKVEETRCQTPQRYVRPPALPLE